MKSKQVHIVAFNLPYPPNYGGVIDVFYKLKALKEAGIAPILHAFQYGRDISTGLHEVCQEVITYPRKTGFRSQLSKRPYIVQSRRSSELLNHLLEDDAPVLFEGIHSTYHLQEVSSVKKVVVRTHNIEHAYYHHLKKSEKNLVNKLYYHLEEKKLRNFEHILKNIPIAAISKSDADYFSQYGETMWIPPFHPNSRFKPKAGMGKYLLYQGNLSVAENLKSVQFLLDNVLPFISTHTIIAGKNPPRALKEKTKKFSHVSLVANPSGEHMQNLIQDAHIHLLPTFQPTGVKLKLLQALFNGRHCIVNPTMLNGTELDKLCVVCEEPEEYINSINNYMQIPFGEKEMNLRHELLSKNYSNTKNIEKLIHLLFNSSRTKNRISE